MRILEWDKRTREFTTVSFSPDGALVVAGGGYDRTAVWEVATGASRGWYDAVSYQLEPLRFHPRSGHLFVPSPNGLKVYDANTRAEVGGFADGLYVGALAFDPASDWCVCCHYPDYRQSLLSAFRWPGAADPDLLWRTPVSDVPNESKSVLHLACLGDGERFVSAERVFGLKYNYRVTVRSRADGRVLTVAEDIFRYGQRVFASHLLDAVVVMDGKHLRFRPIDNLTAVTRVLKNDGRKHFTGVAFHPSGKYLAATSNDETVKLYDTVTWDVAHTFTWDVGRMRSIAFSPDGTLAAAGSARGKVIVWDLDL